MDDSLKDCSLVLAMHGSTEDDRPRKAGQWLASALMKEARPAEVIPCYYKHDPWMQEALGQCSRNKVLVQPMLMSNGYFAQKVFPKALGISQDPIETFPTTFSLHGKQVCCAPPLGNDPALSDLVLGCAADCLERYPFPVRIPLKSAAIALVGHGTPRHSQSTQSALDVVAAIQQRHEACSDIRAFFIEEPPRVEEILQWSSAAKDVVVVPFMIADGPHAILDIPLALGEPEKRVQACLAQGSPTWRNPTQRNRQRIWITPPVGLSHRIPALITRRLRELAGRMLAKDSESLMD
jgi:sirohydrochlorin cobaltochelatase